jgi:hypothetical protein
LVPLAKMVRRVNQALQVLLENEVNKVLQGEMVVMEKMETTSLKELRALTSARPTGTASLGLTTPMN